MAKTDGSEMARVGGESELREGVTGIKTNHNLFIYLCNAGYPSYLLSF